MPAGYPTRTITYTEGSASATSSVMLAANDNRVFASFQNDSDTAIYLRVGETAVANEGIRINPSGGSYTMSPALGNLSLAAVNGITATGASKVVLVQEAVAP